MMEWMLEHYQFKGASVAMQAMLVLYAQGLLTGVERFRAGNVVYKNNNLNYIIRWYLNLEMEYLIVCLSGRVSLCLGSLAVMYMFCYINNNHFGKRWIKRLDVAGRNVTERLVKLLQVNAVYSDDDVKYSQDNTNT